jgi:hypothetical protein
METLIHDPYLNTVKRSLEDKKYKELQVKKRSQVDNFLKKKFEITDYIQLPEGVANMLFFIAFLVIPYIVGISFIFIVIARASLDTFWGMNINAYSIYWAIGYEVIASFLLFIIIKSAITFRKL